MKVKLLVVDKTDDNELIPLINRYSERIQHYLQFEFAVIPKPKNAAKLPLDKLKETEGLAILANIENGDQVIVLDELGKQFSSREFADLLTKRLNAGTRQLVFVIGGAFGFSEAVYQRADSKMALSKMTFTHQMIRLLFVEQLYRACSINKGEKYHH
jgi:23S rRNA (pseudouridine1915-N3)-methyltransferase